MQPLSIAKAWGLVTRCEARTHRIWILLTSARLVLAGNRSDDRIVFCELFDVSLTVSPVKDDNGHVIGASKLVRDITDQKATEAALMEQEKLATATKLLNELAHNINNPLQGLTNLVYLAAETDSGTDAKTLAKEMSDDLKRLSDLVRRILELPTRVER